MTTMDVALLVLIYNRMGRVKEGSVFDELGQIFFVTDLGSGLGERFKKILQTFLVRILAAHGK
jgi:hypothetical protein